MSVRPSPPHRALLLAAAAAWSACTGSVLLAASAAQPAAETSAGPAEGTAGAPRLTLERLYSLPRLIGTAPSGPAWSADSRSLAFLWNDEGREFRDLWVLEVDDPELRPERWTRMPRPPRTPEGNGPPESDPALLRRDEDRRERDPGVTTAVWHPDGRRLLFGFRGDLWEVSAGSEPRRLTETPAAELDPAYSPNGRTLAYRLEGDLWTLALEAPGSERPVADPVRRTDSGDPDVRISDFRWSPDGSRIVVLETDERPVPLRSIPDYLTEEPVLDRVRRAYPGDETARRRLGIVEVPEGGEAGAGAAPAADGAPPVRWIRLADPEPELLLSYELSPEGRRLAVDTSDLYAKDRRVFVVELHGGDRREIGTPRVVARDRDPDNETYYFWRIAWSTDSRSVYFLSDREEDYHVWAVPVDGGAGAESGPRRLTRGPWAVAEMHPVDGGLVVVGNRGRAEERHLFRVADGGRGGGDPGEPVRLSRRPGTHTPVVSPDGRHAAVLFSSDTTPPDLFLTALEPTGSGGDLEESERRVTTSPLAEFSRYRWAAPLYVAFPSHVDGTTLHGRLTLPPDFDPERRHPAILGSVYTDTVRNQWGGRTAHPTWGLDQYLAQEGYVLLNVDMRGSWGRGREHRRGIRLDYGGMDVEDLESGVRFLATLGYVDMERVGIWGSSYGGLMTCMSLFRKPQLYAAGVAGAPATNVWHALPGQMAVMMRPEDQPEEYADSSPFLHAHGLEDPLMIIHGMRDRVVLFRDTVHLVQRLIWLGKDVDLVALPDAGHGWDAEGLAQTRFAFRKLVRHFDRHLKGGCE